MKVQFTDVCFFINRGDQRRKRNEESKFIEYIRG